MNTLNNIQMEEDIKSKQTAYPIGENNNSNEFSSPIKPINNSQPPLSSEERAMSIAFNQMVSTHSSTMSMDKNQFYEMFIQFQNYLTSQSAIQNCQLAHLNQFTISKTSEKSCIEDRETDEIIKDKHKPNNALDSLILPSHKDDHLGENSSRNSKMNAKIDTNEKNKHIPSNKNNSNNYNYSNSKNSSATTPNNNSNNYDEIPIKTTNANFMELFEKSLANDNTNINAEGDNNPKKKIVKAPPIVSHPKKNIQVSKPTKNEKKYFYYTDLLDENGKLVEEKKLSKTLKTGQSSVYNQQVKSEQGGNKDNEVEEDNEEQLNMKNTKKQLLSTKNDELAKKIRKSINNIQPLQPQCNPGNDVYHNDSEEDNEHKVFSTSKTENVFQSVDSNNQEADYLISLTDDKPNDLDDQQYDQIQQLNQKQSSPQHHQYDKYLKQQRNTENIDDKMEQMDSSTIPKSQQLYQDIIQPQPIPQQQPIQEKKSISLTNKEQIIEKKISELNSEIIRFKEEKEKVDNLKAEYEKLHYKLQSDVDELNERKNSFEDWRDEETKKIQKEKKKISQEMKQLVSMKQSAQNLQMMSKRDKDQIDTLKNQIAKMQSEIKQKETTSKLMIDKLKKQIEELSIKRENTCASMIAPSQNTQSNITIANERPRSTSKPSSSTQISKTGKIEQKQKNKINNLNNNSNNTIHNANNGQSYHTPQQLTVESKNIYKKNKQQNIAPFQKQTINNKQSQNKQIEGNKEDTLIEESFDFVLPEKYHGKEYHLLNQETSSDGKIIRLYNNDKREVIFQSGVRKEIYKDGYQIVYFSNGDLKQVFPDNKSVYYFKEAKTVQTTFGDGLQVFKFNNGQIEKHFLDGTKRITFPDGSIRNILQNGYEETYYSDGTIQKIDKDNVIVIEHSNGLKEIKYPDGREECIYPDGFAHEQDNDDENNNNIMNNTNN